ncbi:hypothetical protein CAEBREN_12886 [Caenorhabditis brenneri]|uniref:Domain of unknown function WSN domain-containing protein n=1 Tax=Caenorhabditis brenneri TaxID=135651 RepID=G0PCX1_CAEBE|nr:hypothetical protein CAEBREN_12886 [Caenorhabditis brenneri]
MRRRFILWVFTTLLVLVTTISAKTSQDPVVHWKQNFSNRQGRAATKTFSNPKPNISNGTSEFVTLRFKRSSNDDAFSTLQSRISSLARIVSGVTLYNGLVDGSIPVDEAIGELMNIGSFSLDDLMKFGEKKLDGFVGKLKAASTQMSDKPADLETMMVDLLKIKEMWNEVRDLSKLPDNSKFLELLSVKDVDLKAVQDFDLTEAIQNLTSNPVSDVPNIKSSLKSISDATNKAKKLMEDKNMLTTLTDMTPFHKYVKIISLMEKSNPHDKLSQAYVDEMKADIRILQGIGNDVTSILYIIKGITLSQSGNHVIDRKHTSGFVNGYADLKHLPKDSDHSWLRENFNWLELKDGFTAISNLENGMKTLSGKWTELSKDNIRKAVQQAQFFESELGAVSDSSKMMDNLINDLKNYPTLSLTPGYGSKLEEMSRKTSELLRIAEAIREISTLLTEKDDFISKIDVSDHTSIKSVIDILEIMKPHVELIQKGEKLQDISGYLNKRQTDYTEIKTAGSSTSCQAFLNALKNHKGDNLSKVAATANLAIRMRELKTDKDFSTNIGIASTIVSGSVDSIQSIQTAMGDIKTSAYNTQMFSQLKDLQKFSKPLGDSSAVINKIQKVLEKEKQLMNFVNNGNHLSQLKKSSKIPFTDENRNIFEKNWASFSQDSQKCTILLREVKKRRDGVVKPSDDKLESYGSIIEGLDGLPDVVVDVNSLMIAIDASSQSVTRQDINSKLINLKKSLTELGSLDLIFTRQSSSLKGMSQTLAGINDVFLSTTPATMEPIYVPSLEDEKVPEEHLYEDSDGPDNDFFVSADWNREGYTALEYVAFCVLALSFLVIGTGAVWFVVSVCRFSQEEKRKERNNRSEAKEMGKTTKSKSTETATPSPCSPGGVLAPTPIADPVGPDPALVGPAAPIGRAPASVGPAPAPVGPAPAPVGPAPAPVGPAPAPVGPAPAPVGPAPPPRPEVAAAPPPNPNPAPVAAIPN